MDRATNDGLFASPPGFPTEAVKAAEARYARLLAEHGEPSVRLFRELSATFRFRDFAPLCRVVQPFFLDAATYRSALTAAETFYQGMLAVLAAPSFAQEKTLAARPRRRPLLGDAIAKGALLGSRVDMLLTDTGFRILELNPTTPDYLPFGVECSDALAAQFMDIPVTRELAAAVPGRFVSLLPQLFASFVSTHARRGGTGAPSLAIIYVPPRLESEGGPPPREVPPPDPHLLNLFAYLSERGIGIQLCGIMDLEYNGSALLANGVRVDMAFTAGDLEYLDFCPPSDPLFRAVSDGAVAMACGYPLGSALDDKGLIADLSDPATNTGFDPELGHRLSQIVPWTRRVGDVQTTFEGAPVNLLDFIRGNRERLVLKPNLGMGGRGILMGWEMSQERWEHALASLSCDYVVQERVVGKRARLLYLTDGEVTEAELFFDLNPYVWSDGRAEGCLVRLSPTPLLNITQGATMAPAFVLDEQDVAP